LNKLHHCFCVLWASTCVWQR